MSEKAEDSSSCPICDKSFSLKEIEQHANRCIFLNCPEELPKRKRSPSPVFLPQQSKPKLFLNQKSPRDVNKSKQTRNSVEHSFISPVKPETSNIAPLFEKGKNKVSMSNSENDDQTDTNNKKDLSFIVPLAKQVQPKNLDEFFGQNKVLGKATVLRSLLERGEIPNMILWGPPGCGKTSLSGIISEICKKNPKKYRFSSLCGASAGVKEVQSLITVAKNEMKFRKRTILFMDEIHRFNKRQQDIFLLSVEKGEITLIGATTENPSFIINSALLSRCRVIVMEKLDPNDLYCILEKAAETLNIDVVDVENPCTVQDQTGIAIEDAALKWLADISDGDARIALNNLQLLMQHSNSDGKVINIEDIREGIKKSHMLYDRAGEEHYNIISAMHKSIRGSNPNAALYWTTRMIVSGEDPRYIARRLVRAASEDIGNADPTALQLAVTTMEGCQLLGMPEADVLLAQCAIYLARAPKSREADTALANAKRLISECQGHQPSVPMHLRNAPTKLMKNLGYGKLQDGEEFGYMPPALKDVNFFN